MNRDNTLLLVGGGDMLVRKAKRLGLDLILLQHPARVTEVQRQLADLLQVADFTDWPATEPLVRELFRAPGFAAATAMTEAGLDAAGHINDLLRLGGTGYEATRLLRDKWAMRQRLAQDDPAALGAALLRERDDLTSFADRHGYPLIVKPVNATASFGVFRVDGPEAADRTWAEVTRLTGTRTDRGLIPFPVESFLMEQYVDGAELSVESFSFAGRHVVVTITEKFLAPASFTEVCHVLPARLDPGTEAEVRQVVCRFLDLVGIADGPCHTEIRLGSRGPVVIEGHNRPGGDAIYDLVEGAYGVDLISRSFGWPFGLAAELPDRPPAHAGASSRFLVGVPGRVESVAGVQEAREQEGVLDVQVTVRPGDTTGPLRDNWDRLGLIAVTGTDAAAAVRRAAEIAHRFIKISIRASDGTTHLARVAAIEDVADPAAG